MIMKNKKGFISISYLLGLFVGIVLFTALLPVISDQFWNNASATNITGASHTIFSLGTLIVVIIVFAKLTKRI